MNIPAGSRNSFFDIGFYERIGFVNFLLSNKKRFCGEFQPVEFLGIFKNSGIATFLNVSDDTRDNTLDLVTCTTWGGAAIKAANKFWVGAICVTENLHGIANTRCLGFLQV